MSTAELSQDISQQEYNRLLSLLQEYTTKLKALVEDLPTNPNERAQSKQRSARLLSALKKLAQATSQRIRFPEDPILQIELEVRLAELEVALADYQAA